MRSTERIRVEGPCVSHLSRAGCPIQARCWLEWETLGSNRRATAPVIPSDDQANHSSSDRRTYAFIPSVGIHVNKPLSSLPPPRPPLLCRETCDTQKRSIPAPAPSPASTR